MDAKEAATQTGWDGLICCRVTCFKYHDKTGCRPFNEREQA